MSEVKVTNNLVSMLTRVEAEFGNERDIHAIREAIRDRIVVALVDKFVAEHGDEVLAAIDIETIKRKTNEKVTVSALKELVKS